MSVLAYLIPAALLLGLLGLGAFLWALKSGQFEDLDGAAMRILIDDDPCESDEPTLKQSETPDTRKDAQEPLPAKEESR